MRKLYIDVTQAYGWRGPVAGIIRVMDELSIRFKGVNDYEVIYVVWREQDSSFVSVDFHGVLKERDKSKIIIKNAREFDKEATPTLSRYIKRILKRKKAGTGEQSIGAVVDIDSESLFFTPHGGVWESDQYISKILTIKKSGATVVQVLHDLCPVVTPQFCSEGIRRTYKNYMSKTLQHTNLILAVSENTAKDCRGWLKSLGQESPPIKIFREGDEITLLEAQKPSMDLPEKYILCVGTVEARKNHTILYYAYKLAQKEGKDLPPLLIVGKKGWMADDIYEIIESDPVVKEKITFLHGVTDTELAWLYQNALFSVFPSFYEGWGLPVAESLLRGVPCIASEASSIPEIGGKLVEYISPYSSDQIMESIYKLSTNAKDLNNKKNRIMKEYKSTSWDDSFNQVFSAIKEIN